MAGKRPVIRPPGIDPSGSVSAYILAP